MRLRFALVAALSISGIGPAEVFAAPASAQILANDPGPFVQTLSDTAFGVLRSGSRNTSHAQFRTLLRQYFAVDAIGDRLIQRWRGQISPAQYAAYKAALPDYLIGAYADRLYDYADAKLVVVRAQQQGESAAVLTRVTKPGARPVSAIWTVTNAGAGYRVSNLTVGGINLSLTQRADFDAYVQRNGFDKLVSFMKSRA